MEQGRLSRPVDGCLVCYRADTRTNGSSGDNFITQDHIIPRVVMKDHALVLGSLRQFRDNKFPVCRYDHTFIDGHKIPAYARSGLMGLIEYVAEGYPRAVSPKAREMQAGQLVALFSEIQRLCSAVRGPDFSSAAYQYYNRVSQVAGVYVHLWEVNGLQPVSIDMYRRVW